MKRFTKTFMIAAAICVAGFTANAQENLVKNGGFESWEASKPVSWSAYANDGSFSQETTNVKEGTSAIKINANAQVGQYVNGIIEGKQYTISCDYKIISGDDVSQAFRPWIRWQHFVSTSEKSWVNPINDEEKQKMQGDYVNGAVGEWSKYTLTVTAPATANAMHVDLRTYKAAVVIVDNVSVVEAGGAAISSTEANTLSVYAADGVVYVPATAGQNIVVTNVAGQVVANVVAESEVAAINNLPANQVLLVKVGNQVAKVIR